VRKLRFLDKLRRIQQNSSKRSCSIFKFRKLNMALLQISEPGLSRRAAPAHRLAAGIDSGDHQLAGGDGAQRARPETLAGIATAATCCPPWCTISRRASRLAQAARATARRWMPANTISSVKRLMGRSLADIQSRYPHLPYRLQASANGLPMIDTAAGLVNPVRVSADILKALAARASRSRWRGSWTGW
jgi:molecular chaperone HscA